MIAILFQQVITPEYAMLCIPHPYGLCLTYHLIELIISNSDYTHLQHSSVIINVVGCSGH